MQTIGEKIVKTTSTFSARKKSLDSIFLNFFFEKKVLERCQNLLPKNKLKG